MSAITIIIVTYNSADDIADCLLATKVAVESGRASVVVIDNASVDNTVPTIRKIAPWCVLISNARNEGFSRACNQALKIADSEYVLFLNPDARIRNGGLETLREFLDASPSYVACGPRLVDGDGKPLRPSARRLPTLWTQACQLFGLDRLLSESSLFARAYYQPWDYSSDRDVEGLSGAAMLCRAQAVVGLGGFDESVALYLDDIDLCARLRELGKLRYLHGVEVFHAHNQSGKTQPPGLIRAMSLQARYLFLRKHRGKATSAAFVGLVCVSGVLALVTSAMAIMAGNWHLFNRLRDRGVASVKWAVVLRGSDVSL